MSCRRRCRFLYPITKPPGLRRTVMLRDERIIALDDVVVALKNAAAAYEDASGIVAGSDLEVLFIELAGRRQKIAAPLADHIRALGALPRSEAHTSELQSLIPISSAVLCLTHNTRTNTHNILHTS